MATRGIGAGRGRFRGARINDLSSAYRLDMNGAWRTRLNCRGEKQRVGIARTLPERTRILAADEAKVAGSETGTKYQDGAASGGKGARA